MGARSVRNSQELMDRWRGPDIVWKEKITMVRTSEQNAKRKNCNESV